LRAAKRTEAVPQKVEKQEYVEVLSSHDENFQRFHIFIPADFRMLIFGHFL
jgi:hypothetical protein